MPVRLFLPLLALILIATACSGGGGAASPSPSPSPTATVKPTAARTPTPTPSPTPAPTPTPEPTAPPTASLDLSLSQARQGGFLVVRLLDPPADLGNPTAYFAGAGYRMFDAGDRWYRVIGLATYTPVGDYPIEVTGPSGTVAAGVLTVTDGGFQYESIDLPPSSTDLLQDQAAVDAERATLNAIYAGFTPVKMWSGAWSWPAVGTISNVFGLQRSINGGAYYPHSGTDIANEKGTSLMASSGGTVVLARAMYLYGNVVVIDHGLGVYTSYNHMDSITVAEGQSVSQGDVLGAMGETGFVNGPHVHWEAIISGVRTDPTLWTLGPVEP
jgi:hypothetical protein